MSILIDQNTRVLVQGATGRTGSFQTKIMKKYGTNITAAVTPGKGGSKLFDIPVYDFVEDAVNEHDINAAISFVPARFAYDAAMEIIDTGISFLVLTAQGVPDHDVVDLIRYAKIKDCRILGPDTPGIISPGKCKMGVHPDRMFTQGKIGVLSKSGSLSYEICKTLTENRIGQSTVIGIGGGPIWGLSQVEVLELFQEDEETGAIVLLGEIGGTMEEEAAEYIKEHVDKPVISMIVGRSAPEETQMGHVGAIIEADKGTAWSKIKALENAGCYAARMPVDVLNIIKELGIGA